MLCMIHAYWSVQDHLDQRPHKHATGLHLVTSPEINLRALGVLRETPNDMRPISPVVDMLVAMQHDFIGQPLLCNSGGGSMAQLMPFPALKAPADRDLVIFWEICWIQNNFSPIEK